MRLIFLLLSFIATASFCQRRQADILERKGDDEFSSFRYHQAARDYQDAVTKDSTNGVLKFKVAESLRLANQLEDARAWYDKAFRDQTGSPDPVYKVNFAKVLRALGYPDEARKWLLDYQQQSGPDPLVSAQLKGLADSHTFDKHSAFYAAKPVEFNSEGADFSAYPYRKGFVFVSSRSEKGLKRADPDGRLRLFYTEESDSGTFSIPELLESGSVSAYHEGPAVFFDEGTRKIISRNRFVRNSGSSESVKTLELAFSALSPSGKWSDPIPIPLAGPEYSVAHPAITADGATLYFASDMPGTVGQSDLFVSHMEHGVWSAPSNLGLSVNTPGQELFPFLYNDSLLFFASNGHSGLGGLDIFYCDLHEPDPQVKNFGAPVNSPADDFALFLETGGSSGFFSSNRKGGAGADDLYYFEEVRPFAKIRVIDGVNHDVIRDAAVTLFSDKSIAARTLTDLSGNAEFRLSPLTIYTLVVSAGGYDPYEMELIPQTWPLRKDFQIRVSLQPSEPVTETISSAALKMRKQTSLTNVISFQSGPPDVDIAPDLALPDSLLQIEKASVALPILKIVAVEVVNDLPAIMLIRNDIIFEFRESVKSVLTNEALGLDITIPHGAKRHDYEHIISSQLNSQGYMATSFLLIRSFFFDTGKSWIRNDACAQLDKIIEIMHAFPGLRMQMTFHSDSRGTERFNLDLSKTRAETVKQYLLRAGIVSERVESRFVGEGQLLNDCGDLSDCDELLHQTNRTVEFKFSMQ